MKNIHVSISELKKVLIGEYRKYYDTYRNKIIAILRDECKDTFFESLKKNKYDIFNKSSNPVPFEKLEDYINNKTEKEYCLTTFDFILLVNYYKINTVLFTFVTSLPNYRKTAIVAYSNDQSISFDIVDFLNKYTYDKKTKGRKLTPEEQNTDTLPTGLFKDELYSYIVIPSFEMDNGKSANKKLDKIIPEYKLIGIENKDNIEVSFNPIEFTNEKTIKKTKKNSKGGMKKRKTRKIRK